MSLSCAQNYVVLLDSTLPRSQYDYVLPQVSFAAVGYHKHVTLIFNPTVSTRASHRINPQRVVRTVATVQYPWEDSEV